MSLKLDRISCKSPKMLRFHGFLLLALFRLSGMISVLKMEKNVNY